LISGLDENSIVSFSPDCSGKHAKPKKLIFVGFFGATARSHQKTLQKCFFGCGLVAKSWRKLLKNGLILF
jgi:hypothetical protein